MALVLLKGLNHLGEGRDLLVSVTKLFNSISWMALILVRIITLTALFNE